MKSTACKEENTYRGTASEFIQERKYLKNVTPKTLAWYQTSFKAFGGALESEAAIKQRIIQLRDRGVSPHTLRHTFAVQYLRAGGNLFYLSKILGHSSVTTTQKYLQSVGVDDLQAVHDRLTPLGVGLARGCAPR